MRGNRLADGATQGKPTAPSVVPTKLSAAPQNIRHAPWPGLKDAFSLDYSVTDYPVLDKQVGIRGVRYVAIKHAGRPFGDPNLWNPWEHHSSWGG